MQFEFDVGVEDLFVGELSDGLAEDLPGLVQILLADLEVTGHDPQFAEGEFLVWDQFKRSLEHFLGLLDVLGFEFLKNGVVVPEVDVPAPVSLFFYWRDLFDCFFEGLPYV